MKRIARLVCVVVMLSMVFSLFSGCAKKEEPAGKPTGEGSTAKVTASQTTAASETSGAQMLSRQYCQENRI